MHSTLIKTACYLTLALTMAPETTMAVRLADTQEDAAPSSMNLQADLSLPLSVELGEAKFTNKACECEACSAEAALDAENLEETEELVAEDITEEALDALVEPEQ